METATVTHEGECQTVRLPKGFHIPTTTVGVRLDRAGAEPAAKVRAELERRGIPIGPYDLLIRPGKQSPAI
jgi:hypothetical protein